MGPALPWYWDDYIEPQGLYSHFSALSGFAEGIRFISDGYAPVERVGAEARVGAEERGGAVGRGGAVAAIRTYLLRSADSSKLAGYLLNERYNWREVREKGLPPAVKHAILRVAMRDGSYIVSWSDCRTNALVKKSRVTVNSGVLKIECPDVEWDVAVKVVPEG